MIYRGQVMAMGTRLDVVLPAVNTSFGNELTHEIAELVEEWEQSLSTYRIGSAAMLINQTLSRTRSAVVNDPLLWQALELAERGYQLTQGWFNVACGRLYRLYKQGLKADNKKLKAYSGMQFKLDKKQQQLHVNSANAFLDFGGLGKGLALDSIQQLLLKAGVKNGFLSFGESSILALGQHPQGGAWPVSYTHLTLPTTSRV